MTATEQFIDTLTRLKTGDLGLLRTYTGQGIDKSVKAFDLFAGLWWPLRQKSERAPRREVAWLIAKLYALCHVPHSPGSALARQVRQCEPREEDARRRFRQKFDAMLLLPLDRIEPALHWAIAIVASGDKPIDWAKLTDDLSIWERQSVRLKWTQEFLNTNEGERLC